jgi:hypothetical protein
LGAAAFSLIAQNNSDLGLATDVPAKGLENVWLILRLLPQNEAMENCQLGTDENADPMVAGSRLSGRYPNK